MIANQKQNMKYLSRKISRLTIRIHLNSNQINSTVLLCNLGESMWKWEKTLNKNRLFQSTIPGIELFRFVWMTLNSSSVCDLTISCYCAIERIYKENREKAYIESLASVNVDVFTPRTDAKYGNRNRCNMSQEHVTRKYRRVTRYLFRVDSNLSNSFTSHENEEVRVFKSIYKPLQEIKHLRWVQPQATQWKKTVKIISNKNCVNFEFIQ